jgi:hypothetical protein
MKKRISFIILLVIACFIITGCGSKKIETNQSVSLLQFYVPEDFQSRTDLRGLIYNDDTRKVFGKGDNTDYSTFMYIDVIKQVSYVDLDTYISNVNNNNLKDGDVKFIKKNNSELPVYGRDGYETTQGTIEIINYAYITNIEGSNYTITISGPNNKKEEVATLAINILNTLEKNKTS